MQYIQLQGQLAADLDLPIEGSYNLFIDTSDNSIKAKDSDGHMHGGGGLSLTELTRDELGELVISASLTPGAFYKITGAASQSFLDANEFGYSGYGNEIQQGGTTIILQAATDATLSKKGIGLFYVPNYENPNQLTAPPDYNYLTWDNTHRIYLTNVEGKFPLGAGIQIYSSGSEVTTSGYLEGSLEGSGSGYVTLRLSTHNDTFFQDANNLVGLEISTMGAIGYIDGYDYTSSYAPGDCVIFGNRVWQNLSGSIGYREGGNQWPINALNLNEEDWTLVPFDEVHYTLQAHTIEYDFEHDNISYRSDGTNEVRCEWSWWNNNYGYNTVSYFPWGHYGVQNVSFTNTYLHHFVNFPWDSNANDIKFGHNSLFNATTWGRGSYFNSMYGVEGADFGGNNFARGTSIWDITFDIDAEFRNVRTTSDAQIYEIVIGSNASFYDVNMYYSSEIYDVEIGTSAYFGNSTHYEWTNVYNVELGINASLGSFTLETYSEIKDITIGANSYIQYFDLAYSACLKRTTIASDAYMGWFDIGVDSFIRQVNLSDRAYIESFNIGDNANLQNIDLGTYAYMNNFNGGQYTNFENIKLDARAYINNVYLGYNGGFSQIQIAPNSYIYNVNYDINPSPYTSSYISGITIEPHSYIGNIDIGSNTNFQNIYLGTDANMGDIVLEEGSNMADINLLGSGGIGAMSVCSGSEISNFQLGIGAGFGEMTVSASVALTNFELGNSSEFGGTTFTSSINNVTITRAFNNYDVNIPITGTTGSVSWGDSMTELSGNKSFYILDTTGWDASTDNLNYKLPDGNYEGQTVKVFHTNGGSNLADNIQKINIWAHLTGTPNFDNAGDFPWYPFINSEGTAERADIPTAIWINGKWVVDNYQYA